MGYGCNSVFIIYKIPFCGDKHLDPVLHPRMSIKAQKGKVNYI
jgi:hypothetical protein